MKTLYFFIVIGLFFLERTQAQSWDEYFNKGKSQLLSKDYKGAETSFIQARMKAATDFGMNHENYLTTIEYLSRVYFEMGDCRNAITNYRALEKSLRESREHNGSIRHADVLEAIAICYEKTKLPTESALHYQQALNIRKNKQTDKSLPYLTTLRNLAFLYLSNGKAEMAKPLYDQAYTLAKTHYKPTTTEYRDIVYQRAEASYYSKAFNDAIPLYQEHITLCKNAKIDKKDYLDSHFKITQCYLYTGNNPKTVEAYTAYIAFMESIAKDKAYVEALDKAIKTLEDIKENDAAKKLLDKRLTIQKELTGEKSAEYAAVLLEMAIDEKFAGKTAEAEAHFKKVIEIRKATLGENTPEYSAALDELGRFYVMQNKLKEAEDLFKQAQSLRKKYLGESHPDHTKGTDSLAYFYISQQRYDEADSLLNFNLKIRGESVGKQHGEYGLSLHHLANLYTIMQKYKEAEPLYKE
ncbi:MAG: tetratricopeptide repeat protein, partial [Flammeovirgaceae bacterium]|nr:tetratricopeptide repeat protein [Flammeovirgaceae bacterium]MDW8286790.1 tetratricopeptide repeat protein [Flammeovirgaceae bacterium]